MNLIEIEEAAANCTECALHTNRKVPVFSKGWQSAKIMIVGMCPGPGENDVDNNPYKLPFIGKTGKLLDTILKDVDLDVYSVYITNIVKCFLKPGIRLEDEWVDSCMSYLIAQIAEVNPTVILALGADVGRKLLGESKSYPLASMRNRSFKFMSSVNVVVTYHPSYFLRGGGIKHPHYGRIIDDLITCEEIVKESGGSIDRLPF